MTGQIHGPKPPEATLEGHRRCLDAGWGLEVLLGLLHRASSQCKTLLPPKEGECDHVFPQPDPQEGAQIPQTAEKPTGTLSTSRNQPERVRP